MLIPRSEGQFEIPEFQFAYFDPKLGQYVTRTISSVSIKVNPGDPKAMQSVTNKSDIKVLNSDINYIKTRPVKLSTLASVSAVPVFLYVGLGLIVLLWLITFLILRHLWSPMGTTLFLSYSGIYDYYMKEIALFLPLQTII